MTDLPHEVRASWHRFADVYEPLRPELYRYCRHLTRSAWDAEDLAQDALARAFVTLGRMAEAPPNPRAWLFRVASNLWIDRMRRPRVPESVPTSASSAPVDVREAAGTLLVQLAPQERAAVVLKDVFDFSLEEIAGALGTTTGAIKAALHRGRGKLAEPDTAIAKAPVPGAIDAFCAAFNAHDLDRVAALLLDNAIVEVVGASASFGDDANRKTMLRGMMFGAEHLSKAQTKAGGIDPRLVRGALPLVPRAEVRFYRDEPIVLLWYAHSDGEAVRGIDRFEIEGDRITRLANYFYNPDPIGEVCNELGVEWRSNGYTWWLDGCET
jgi:RNA polymerase sigma-70 factor, ECF subfamily